ncbi:MAG TPA: sugar nucleotide-binding protein [Chlamydiales bacterium]|mgnify:CR=1 FL=1|nr:sugar nucleotide-binding protein [Chlamydiales bacterium]
MKILLLGGSGRLGQALQNDLKKEEIDFDAPGSKELDITNKTDFQKFMQKGYTHLILTAAMTDVEKAEVFKNETLLVNSFSLENICPFCKQEKIRLIYISSDYVFGGGKKEIGEEEKRSPVNLYGYSKMLAEILIQKSGIPYVILRLSWLFDFIGTNFFTTVEKSLFQNKVLYGNVLEMGRPTYVGDASRATINLLDEEGIFHFGSKEGISRFEWMVEIANIIKKGKGLNVRIEPKSPEFFNLKAKRPLFNILKIEKYLKKYSIPSWKDHWRFYDEKKP